MVSFREILTVLSRHDLEFVVVGGVAAVLVGAPSAMHHVDVVHRRTPDNIEGLIKEMQELGARYRSRPDVGLDFGQLESAHHHLLMTTSGPLDFLAN
jgi:hypothetical protein